MSNPIFQQIPVRLQLGIVSSPPTAPIDRNTGETPALWRAQTAALQIGIFDTNNVAVDLSNLGYLQVILQQAQDSLAPLWVKQIDAADIVDTITIADWIAGTAQQVNLALTAADTDQGLGGTNSAAFWLIVVGFTSGGAPIIYGAGALTIYAPGATLPSSIAPGIGRNRQSTTVNDVTVTPTAQIFTQIVDIAGAARTFNVLLGIAGIKDGSKLDLILNLPSTANIVVNVKSGPSTNPTISTVQTGSVLQALLSYYYDADAVAWVPESYLLPPT